MGFSMVETLIHAVSKLKKQIMTTFIEKIVWKQNGPGVVGSQQMIAVQSVRNCSSLKASNCDCNVMLNILLILVFS